MIKQMFLAAIALALAGTTAQAKCGTSQLNGTWIATTTFDPSAAGSTLVQAGEVVVLNGTIDGSDTISQTIGCKVTIDLGGVVLTGRSDRIPSTSKAKPGLVSAGVEIAEGTFVLHMVRK